MSLPIRTPLIRHRLTSPPRTRRRTPLWPAPTWCASG
jgi:hypothetical protein